jgi:hypothetical protein
MGAPASSTEDQMRLAMLRRSFTAPRHLRGLRLAMSVAVCLICAVGAIACALPFTGNARPCGNIGGAPGSPGDAYTHSAEVCLLHAATQCTAATLTYTEILVDVGTIHLFTVTPQFIGRCTITDKAQAYSANGGGSRGPPTTYTCAAIQPLANGVVVRGCGAEGDVFLPGSKGTA